jgi:hypothetical protein
MDSPKTQSAARPLDGLAFVIYEITPFEFLVARRL